MTMQRLLFLCTGNYYRSRFAEIFFNWHAQSRGLTWRAESRGLALDAANPGPLSRHTAARLEALQIPFDAYLRMPVDLAVSDLEAAHHIVAVKTTEHRPLLSQRFPQWLDRVEFWNIDDIDCAPPDDAIPHLETQLVNLVRRLSP